MTEGLKSNFLVPKEHLWFVCLCLICLGISLIYKVVLLSAGHQSEPVVHTHISTPVEILSHTGHGRILSYTVLYCAMQWVHAGYLLWKLFLVLNFLALLGLHRLLRAFSGCGEWGQLLQWLSGWVAQALGAQTSAVAACGLSRGGAWAQRLHIYSMCIC